MIRPFITLSFILTLLAGCTHTADFPTLSKRPFEGAPAAPVPAPPAPAALSDPALVARIEAALADARAGEGSFSDALKSAAPAVEAANSAGVASDAWINAQLQVSRLERTLAPATEALARLDGERTRLIEQQPGSPDRQALGDAISALQQLVDRQRGEVVALIERLKR
jgi:hypothetical protein